VLSHPSNIQVLGRCVDHENAAVDLDVAIAFAAKRSWRRGADPRPLRTIAGSAGAEQTALAIQAEASAGNGRCCANAGRGRSSAVRDARLLPPT
jgi:hypothetical protein